MRGGPTREHSIAAVRKKGDEVLIAEERGGWVRLSDEDEEYPYVGEGRVEECWMLIDGAEVGLGILLEEQQVKRDGEAGKGLEAR